LDDDDFNLRYLRELSAIKLLADRLLRPRLALDPAQVAAIIGIAAENLDLMSQQGSSLYWTHVVPRTLLVRQAEHAVGGVPVPAPLADALRRLRDAFRSRDPELQQRVR
jgi:hypothetical protein